MKDDDLDLELDDEPARPVKRPAPYAAPKPAVLRPAATATGATPGPAGSVESAPTASAPGSGTKKSLVGRASDFLAGMKSFTWNTRAFLILLAVLIGIVLIAENWHPVRFYFLGLAFEIPKAVSFILDVGLGALLMWLLLRRPVGGEAER